MEMELTTELYDAFKLKNISKIEELLNLQQITNIDIFRIYYKKYITDIDIHIIKLLIKYFVSKQINIHENNYEIFISLCRLGSVCILKWFLEYCDSINNRISLQLFTYELCELCYDGSDIVKYMIEYGIQYKEYYTELRSIIYDIISNYNISLLEDVIELYYLYNIRLDMYDCDIIYSAQQPNRNTLVKYLIYLIKHKYNGFNIIIDKKLLKRYKSCNIIESLCVKKDILLKYNNKCVCNNKLCSVDKIEYNSDFFCLDYIIIFV